MTSITRRSFALPVALPLALFATACSGPAPNPTPASPAIPTVSQPEESADPLTRKIDVGGHSLTLLTRGKGGPTVVIEAGFGLAAVESDEWKPVCDELAKSYRVCLYNRAGLGTSEPAPAKPRTSRDVARDLHELLARAKVPGPYLLVAHSIGGLHARVYVDRYSAEVAGLVLVDATHPDQEVKWLETLPAGPAGEVEAVKQARGFLTARLADKGQNPEGLDLVASREQVRAAKPLGAKPLAVLTHSPDWKMVPQLPDDVLKPIERASQALQAELPKLSTNSSHTVAKKAGHAIHVDEPALVIAAVREVAGKIQSGK
jgi:pimeloyl-ACP methyl ester carboxylesterase